MCCLEQRQYQLFYQAEQVLTAKHAAIFILDAPIFARFIELGFLLVVYCDQLFLTYVLAVPCLHPILDVIFNFFIEARTAYSVCSAVILSGGYASNGAATNGSQSDGDSSNTTVSAPFSCGSWS